MAASGNRVFWRWSIIYFAVAGFYALASDTVWETMRGVLPDRIMAGLFFLCGPIISTDFIHFFSPWPFIFETLVVLLLLSVYAQTTQLRYLALLSGVWLASLEIHSQLMGRLA